MSPNAVRKAAREARRNTIVRAAARAGFAVNGLLHGIIGALAIAVSLGAAAAADQSGAFAEIAAAPAGEIVLWVVVLGLTALGLWLIVGALLRGRPRHKREAGRLVVELGKGVAYIALALIGLPFAMGRASSGSSGSEEAWTARLLAAPGGVLLIALVGAIVAVVGGYFVVKGIRRRFLDDIDAPQGAIGAAIVGIGVVGYVAKGFALGVVGALLIAAAVTADASKAHGLDGALKELVALPAGAVLLFATGVGFLAYGVYCVVRARVARL